MPWWFQKSWRTVTCEHQLVSRNQKTSLEFVIFKAGSGNLDFLRPLSRQLQMVMLEPGSTGHMMLVPREEHKVTEHVLQVCLLSVGIFKIYIKCNRSVCLCTHEDTCSCMLTFAWHLCTLELLHIQNSIPETLHCSTLPLQF